MSKLNISPVQYLSWGPKSVEKCAHGVLSICHQHFSRWRRNEQNWQNLGVQPRCGVTGWTNFLAISLFLLSIIHNLATIGTVPGVSDNFLIFWTALGPTVYISFIPLKLSAGLRFRLTKVRFTLYFVWTRKIAEGASFFSSSQHEDSRPILLAAPMPTGEMGRKRRYIYAIICCCASSLWICSRVVLKNAIFEFCI